MPKISSSLPIIKWIESFSDILSYIVESRNISLVYVIRLEVSILLVSSVVRAADRPYSIE